MKTYLTIVLMVFISLGALAQKPQNSPELIHNNLQFRKSSPRENFLAKKQKATDRHEKYDRKTRRMEYKKPGNLKAGLALPTHQMDSIIDTRWNAQTLQWEVALREWLKYDSLGNNTVDGWLGADGPVFPDYGGKWEAVWDANGRLIEETDYDWYGIFEPTSRTNYSYDGNGRLHIINSERWNMNFSRWDPDYTDTITWGTGDVFLEFVAWGIDTSGVYVPGQKSTNEFDSTGIRTRHNQYTWNTTAWELAYYTDFFTDEMGRDTSIIDYYFNGSWWQENQKRIYTYDAMGNITLDALYYWDGDSQWIGNNKSEMTYDGANRVKEELYNYWDFSLMKWFIVEKTTFAYDGNGNIIEEALFLHDTATLEFFPDWKEVYEYDLTIALMAIAIPLELEEEITGPPEFHINHKIEKYTDLRYDGELLRWDTTYQEVFKYSPFGYKAPANCKANFGFAVDQNPLLLYFSDASGEDASSWYWSFGDGTSSTQQHPEHLYASPGTYKVSLSTIDETGECTNTVLQQIAVGNSLCNAEFRMTVDTVAMTVDLVNSSQGANLNYFWSFGDGEGSKLMSPTHTYSYPGNYTISLTVQNALGTCMDRYSLITRVGTGLCKADFAVFVDPNTNTAKFRAVNQNPDNLYRWEFGDGSFEKTANVNKTFTHQGYYTATLKVSNTQANCVNTQTATVLIGEKSPGGKAGFISMSGNGNKVRFSDRSLGEKLKYYWNFGGTDTSTMQNPMHDFVLPGYYSVCLTVVTPDGERNTHCEKIFAGEDTQDECLARFEYRLTDNQRGITCLDRSLGDPDQWKWTYDDGWSTTQQNPSWSTGGPRYLKLQQTIRNTTTGCRDDAVAIINMGADAALKAGFGYVIDTNNNKADTYPIDFIGVSLGDAGKLKWSFGDGTYDSTTINPIHNYANPGTYEVCLTVINTTTGEEDKSCEMVTVGSISSTNDLSWLNVGLKSYPNPFRESTKIEIQLTEESRIDLSVYDLMGRKLKTVAREHRPAGSHILELDGSDLDAGNYFLILETSYGKSRSVLSIVR